MLGHRIVIAVAAVSSAGSFHLIVPDSLCAPSIMFHHQRKAPRGFFNTISECEVDARMVYAYRHNRLQATHWGPTLSL